MGASDIWGAYGADNNWGYGTGGKSPVTSISGKPAVPPWRDVFATDADGARTHPMSLPDNVGEGAGQSQRVHTPARSADKAEKYASGLGVQAKYTGNVDLGNMINDHLTALSNRRVKLPPKVEIRCMHPADAAEYNPGLRSISINPNSRFWNNPKKIAFEMGSKGIWSTTSRLHVLTHEIGHWLHHFSDPEKFTSLQSVKLTANQEGLIKAAVSERAAESPFEFVAEVYAGKVHGKHYPAEIDKLYQEYGGPKP